MTWSTPLGERKLTEAECRLISFLIDDIFEIINSKKKPLIFGPFQDLRKDLKISVLLDVVQNLFNETSTCPKLSALNESAIWYLFVHLKQIFDDDLAYAESRWGWLVENALDATEGMHSDSEQEFNENSSSDEDSDEEDFFEEKKSVTEKNAKSVPKNSWRIVSVGCLDYDRWCQAIDILADNILWDRDFEMLGEFGAQCSIKPDQVKMALECLGEEDQDYYNWVKPQHNPHAKEELEELIFPYLTSTPQLQKSSGYLMQEQHLKKAPRSVLNSQSSSRSEILLSEINAEIQSLPRGERLVSDQISLDKLGDAADSPGSWQHEEQLEKKISSTDELQHRFTVQRRELEI